MRIIFHLDMDAFYASVEEREHPELKGKAIVVGADPKGGTGRGVVSTCSYEARRHGIHSAMPISKAYKLCPEAAFLPVNMKLYVETSERIMAIVSKYSDKIEQVSVDEAYADVTGKISDFETAKELALKMKQEIFEKEKLTCSIGISSNKLAAKIASDYQKPSGLTIVPKEKIKDFFSILAIRKLPGVGEKTEKELKDLGINTMGELASYDLQKLLSKFGKWGLYLHEAANGVDESEVTQDFSIKSINRNSTFEEDTDDPAAMKSVLNEMAEEIKNALDEDSLAYKTIGIRIRYSNFDTHTRERSFARHENSVEKIKLISSLLLDENLDKKRKVRQVGLRVSGLKQKDQNQANLSSFF